MHTLVDIVNFNPDASCVDPLVWLDALRGGKKSTLYRWLNLYVDTKKPINIGFMGGALVDMQTFNPESLQLIKNNRQTFEIIGRPFTHDLQTFRSVQGFLANVGAGMSAIKTLLGCSPTTYLPPEFMQTNRQVGLLQRFGIETSFLLPERFTDFSLGNTFNKKYLARGIPDGEVELIVCSNGAYKDYLSGVQLWDSSIINSESGPRTYRWRDGESFLLFPSGIEREEWLLNVESSERVLLANIGRNVGEPTTIFYPPHPFSAWSNEMSMSWFMSELTEFERTFVDSSSEQKAWWLLAIGSDVIASLEKPAPVITLKRQKDSSPEKYRISRFPRAALGESLMSAVETSRLVLSDSEQQKIMEARHIFLKNYLDELRN